MGAGEALDAVGAGDAAPLAPADQGREFAGVEALEANPRLAQALGATSVGRDDGDAGDHAMAPAGDESQHPGGVGLVDGLAEDPAAHGHDRVGAQDEGAGIARRPGHGLHAGETDGQAPRRFTVRRRLIDIHRIDAVRRDTRLGEELAPPRARAGEDQRGVGRPAIAQGGSIGQRFSSACRNEAAHRGFVGKLPGTEPMAIDLETDADDQDQAETFDETHITEDGEDIAHLDMARNVYDVTTADGDGGDDDLADEDPDDFDPDALDESELESLLEEDDGVDDENDEVKDDDQADLVAEDDDSPAAFEGDDEDLEDEDEVEEPGESRSDIRRDVELDETFPASDPLPANPGSD